MRRSKGRVSTNTRYDVMDMRSIIIAVLASGTLTTIIFALVNSSRPQMLVLGGIFIVTLIVSYFGYHQVGSWVALLSALAMLSYFIVVNNGIRDTAMIGLVTVLIAAGLLAGKTGTIIVGILLILELGVFGELESRGILVNKFSSENTPIDYLALSIFVALISIIQWLVISRLNRTILNAKQEIADRQIAEEKLRDAESRYRNLVEKIPLVVYIAEPGNSGLWDYVSPQITNLTGFTPEEWIGQPGLWSSLIHPDDREAALKAETRALHEGTMPQMEYRLKTRDGSFIWVYDESILTISAENRILVQGFLLDISTRKLAEEQLQMRLAELQAIHGVSETLVQKTDLLKLIHETGEQIRLTFKANNVLIALHDPQTNLIQFPYDFQDNAHQRNQPIKFGEGMTTRIMEMKKPLIIHENWAAETKKLNAIYTNGIPVLSAISIPIMIKDRVLGVITLESVERHHAFNDNDVRLLSTITANLAVAIDNTRLQESLKQELHVQEELVRELAVKNEELERFSYTASHDLKSPLITIRGFLGYLEKDAQDGNIERLRADIKRISDATLKMHRLLTELLELSRVGRIVSEKQDLNFETIVSEALRRVEGQLLEKQVTVQLGSNFPIVHVDKERLVEVIQNLVDNAVKFMGGQAQPQVEINHLTKDGQCVFYVRDNGIGIRREFHERIFGLFDKLNAESEGTGVGLALVKRIIEVHGGKIWVESEEGAGATFYFTLNGK